MSQIRGTAGYNLGHQNPFGGPGRADATDDPSPLDAIREQTSKIEDWLDAVSDPIKPYDLDCLDFILFYFILFFLFVFRSTQIHHSSYSSPQVHVYSRFDYK
jgi:hypothetical protein